MLGYHPPMDRLAVIGLSWRHADSAWVARCTVPPEQRAPRLLEWSERFGVDELLYLATCSRVELVLRSHAPMNLASIRRALFEAWVGRPSTPGEAERWLRVWHGEGAAEHLLMVVTGLDSAQVGETEILGQFRSALALSRDLDLAGGMLGWLADEALRTARKLRLSTGIDQGQTSLAQIVLRHLRCEQARQPWPVGLLGVSPMTERCAVDLAAARIPVVWINRDPVRAQQALARSGASGTSLALDDFRQEPPALAALVSATGAPGPVLEGSTLRALGIRNPSTLVVDLAVTPDVDPAAAQAAGLRRLGIDTILAEAQAASQVREASAVEARLGIDDALEHLRELCGAQALGPMAKAIQAHYHKAAQTALERLFRTELHDLRDDQRASLLQWSQQWAGHMAHLPTTGLREVVREHGPAVLDAYLRHAQPELARDIERAMALQLESQTKGGAA